MSKPLLKIVTNEFKSSRILPEQKPKPRVIPVFEVELVDMWNYGVKWANSLERVR